MGLLSWTDSSPAELIEILAAHSYANKLKVCEQLMLVVDEMFQVPQEQHEQGFALAHKDSRNGFGQVRVVKQGETFLDPCAVESDSLSGFCCAALMIHGQPFEIHKVAKVVRFHGKEHRTEPREAFQEVAEEETD